MPSDDLSLAERQLLDEKQINGVVYAIRAMDPLDVLRDAGKIAALAGPALSSATSALTSDEDSDEGVKPALGQLLAGLFGQLGHPDVLAMTQNLFNCMTADNAELKQAQWRAHFKGNIGTLLDVIVWAAGVQYGPFFSGLLAKAKTLTPKKPAGASSAQPA